VRFQSGEALRHTQQFRFQAGSVENFQVTYSVYPHSIAMRSTQPLTEMSAKQFPWGEVPLARIADSCIVLVVPSAKGWMEAEHSSSPSESS